MPQVFISYSHDSPAHLDQVLALSNRLRADGVDCRIDQYEQSPTEGWPRWCARQIEQSVFVLVVCTEIYLRRFKGEEAPHLGLGGTWEGHIITQELYNAQGHNTKFVPIVISNKDDQFIPLPLQSASRYRFSDNYDGLYRRLTEQPLISMPHLGSVKPMPARQQLSALPGLERKQEFQTVWLVPYARNQIFTGREKILEDLRHTLEKRRSVAISGLGGIGKTQTAIEYAYRHQAVYKFFFWVRAETRETLIAGFASIAETLHLPSAHAKEQEVTIAEVKGWLEKNADWLLVLDNADDMVLTKGFLPRDFKGHLLMTTRARALGGLAERLSIKIMPPEEGALMLLRRAGLIRHDTAFQDVNREDQFIALQIADELGGLPLALDQAGAFIEEIPCDLADYLSLYRDRREQLLFNYGILGDHPSVTVTFSLAFAKVAQESPAAADLIRACAFLAPDAIPEEIFAQGGEELGDHIGALASDALEFTKVLGQAGRLSLLDRDARNKTLDIHRLVQIVTQAGMSTAAQNDWAGRVVRAVAKTFPDVKFQNWEFCRRLLPHSQVCANLIDKWNFEFLEAAVLLNKTAFYLNDRALFSEAGALYQRALAIRKQMLGPLHPDVATTLNNLGLLYFNQGKYADAEPLYQRALIVREQALGPLHPDVGSSFNNLAVLYHSQGKYADAEPLFLRALAIREQTLGPSHPDVANTLNNLGLLYFNQGNSANAEPLFLRAFAIYEQALGREHPDVAKSLNNLAILYFNQGKYAEAEPLYQRSLAIREQALGPLHSDVSVSLNNLAELYRNQGKYADAEPLHQRALAICEQALGPWHPAVARSLNNLALLYSNQGKYADAEPLHQRALAIREQALGPWHSDVANSLNNLAELYRTQGKYADAEPCCQRALAIREQALGPIHPDVANSLNNLAVLYDNQGKYADAEPLYQRALAIFEQAIGREHPAVASSLNNLALLYDNQEKYADAEPLHQRALAIREQALGPMHPDVASSLNNLAELYRHQGRYTDAEPLHRRALTIREQALGPMHPDVANSLNNLALLYDNQGRYADAEPLYQRSLAIYERAFGADHLRSVQVRSNLSRLHESHEQDRCRRDYPN